MQHISYRVIVRSNDKDQRFKFVTAKNFMDATSVGLEWCAQLKKSTGKQYRLLRVELRE